MKPSKHTFVFWAGSHWSLLRNQAAPIQHTGSPLSISSSSHWSLQSSRSLCDTLLDWGLGNNKNQRAGWCQDYLVFKQDRGEMGWHEELGAPSCPVDQQNWSRTLLSLAVQLLKTGCRPPWSAAHVSSGPAESSSTFHLACPWCLWRPAQWGMYRGTSPLLEKMVAGHREEKLIWASSTVQWKLSVRKRM